MEEDEDVEAMGVDRDREESVLEEEVGDTSRDDDDEGDNGEFCCTVNTVTTLLFKSKIVAVKSISRLTSNGGLPKGRGNTIAVIAHDRRATGIETWRQL